MNVFSVSEHSFLVCMLWVQLGSECVRWLRNKNLRRTQFFSRSPFHQRVHQETPLQFVQSLITECSHRNIHHNSTGAELLNLRTGINTNSGSPRYQSCSSFVSLRRSTSWKKKNNNDLYCGNIVRFRNYKLQFMPIFSAFISDIYVRFVGVHRGTSALCLWRPITHRSEASSSSSLLAPYNRVAARGKRVCAPRTACIEHCVKWPQIKL